MFSDTSDGNCSKVVVNLINHTIFATMKASPTPQDPTQLLRAAYGVLRYFLLQFFLEEIADGLGKSAYIHQSGVCEFQDVHKNNYSSLKASSSEWSLPRRMSSSTVAEALRICEKSLLSIVICSVSMRDRKSVV